VFGLSKQGYYQRVKHKNKRMEQNKIVLEIVENIRKRHSRCGTRKLLIYTNLK
jgi:hypothetical protein